MKKYIYFVYFNHVTSDGNIHGNGNCEIFADKEIDSMQDIKDIQESIKQKFNYTIVTISNFILLRTE